ncbi:MAG TPA: hypothetical protein VJY39_12245 [Acidisphaera sp.]|nr:hypothetical protein [Acidisphaera sp.]
MGYAVRAYDEVPGQGRRPVIGLRVVSRQVSAADLIRQWVTLTLADWPAAPSVDTAARLAHPDELALHPGRRLRRRPPAAAPSLDTAHRQALAAFARGRIALLVDDRQIEGAETLIGITDTTEVTFLRLVPLVGG